MPVTKRNQFPTKTHIVIFALIALSVFFTLAVISQVRLQVTGDFTNSGSTTFGILAFPIAGMLVSGSATLRSGRKPSWGELFDFAIRGTVLCATIYFITFIAWFVSNAQLSNITLFSVVLFWTLTVLFAAIHAAVILISAFLGSWIVQPNGQRETSH